MTSLRRALPICCAALLAVTACKNPTVGPSCGDAGNICSGQCVVLATDSANCGTCGHKCDPGAICSDNECGCPVGEQVCENACVNIQTDVNNCGGCGTVCGGLTPICMGGSCQETLASTGSALAVSMVLTASTVFWIDGPTGNHENGAVVSVPIAGGNATTIAQNQNTPLAIVADSASVYWSTVNEGAGSYLVSSSYTGANLTTLVSTTTGLISALAVDDTAIYWIDPDQSLVMKLDKTDGGMPSTLAAGQQNPSAITIENGTVYWATAYLQDGNGAILSIPAVSGGAITTLATGQVDPINLTVDANNAYWMTETSEEVVQVSHTQTGMPLIIATGQYNGGTAGIAVDSTDVYWTTGSVGGSGGFQPTGTIVRVPIGGGKQQTLASAQIEPVAVAVDANAVYWVNSVEDGTVDRLSPK